MRIVVVPSARILRQRFQRGKHQECSIYYQSNREEEIEAYFDAWVYRSKEGEAYDEICVVPED